MQLLLGDEMERVELELEIENEDDGWSGDCLNADQTFCLAQLVVF